jgi:hypothetical protein
MTIGVEHEQPQRAAGEGFSDAVTLSFGDPVANVFGVARIGFSTAAGGVVLASGLGMLFADGSPVAVRADGGLPVSALAWESVDAGGVRTAVVEPLQAWQVVFTSEDGSAGFELDFTARSVPAALSPGAPVARVGGMQGYEQLCRASGSATVGGEPRPIDCLGQRGHTWGAPDWDRITLARTLSAWMGDDLAVTLTAIRPAKARGHGDEAISAFLLVAPEDADVAAAVEIGDPRVSTIYDGDGRQRHAGLELYIDDEDDYGRRLAGEVACGTSLDLGRLRLDCAFFVWRMEGRAGVGRYDILRRA